MCVNTFAQSRGQAEIGFNRDNAAPFSSERPRHLPVTWANFDPNIVWAARESRKNTLLPAWVVEEVLAQFLPRHGDAECNNG